MSALTPGRRRHAPCYPCWEWLLANSMAKLAAEAKRHAWVRDAYAWRAARVDYAGAPEAASLSAHAEAFTFPDGVFPVLAANSRGEGMLALARIAFSSEPAVLGNTRDNTARAASATVAELLRRDAPLMPRIAWVEPEGGTFDGDSVALSCFVLTVAAILNLPVPDDLCATGDWKDGTLSPVRADSLSTKLRVAAEWGFRRLLIVDGQTGLDALWPEERIIRVPGNPVEALPTVVEALLDGQPLDAVRADEALAGVLMVFDRKFVNGAPRDADLPGTLEHTGSILEMAGRSDKPLPLTRFLAHDVRARAYLHAGKSREAGGEAELARGNFPPPPWPEGQLGLYLSHEIHAHGAVVAVDLGRWDDAYPEHRRLDESLRNLESNARTRDRMLVATYLRGTRGMRGVFLGRLHGEAGRFTGALDDFRKYEEHALALANYAVSTLGMQNHGVRRRQNWIIETLEGMRTFAPEEFESDKGVLDALWPAFVDAPEALTPPRFLALKEDPRLSFYDLAAWLKWRVLRQRDIPEETVGRVVRLVDMAGPVRYPGTKILEVILQYRLGNEHSHVSAARLLENADYFLPENRNSILAILAIRGAALLAPDADMRLHSPDRDARPELHALWARLRELPRERRITAAPY